jgi:tetratricopeptide (TPR) repeat protein
MRIHLGLGRLALSGAMLAAAAGCAGSGDRTAANKTLRDVLLPNIKFPSSEKRPDEDVEFTPELKDTSELSLAYARWMEEVGSLNDARRHYGDVLKDKPRNLDALLGIARVDQLSGRPQEAEQGFRKALRLAPESPDALHALGQFYASQERWPEAVDQLNKAMLAAPGEKAYRYHLAVAMVHVGDVNGAMPHFIRSVGDAEAHYNVGLILRDQGKLKDAEQQMLLAVTKKPDLHQAQYWLDELRREQESSLLLAAGSGASSSTVQPASHVQMQSAANMTSNGRHSVGASRPVASQPIAPTPPQLEQAQNQRGVRR